MEPCQLFIMEVVVRSKILSKFGEDFRSSKELAVASQVRLRLHFW
jgi:hypothetical protein